LSGGSGESLKSDATPQGGSEAYRSFGVNMSARQAEHRAEDYRIPGVPTLAIAGKYTVDGDQAKMLTTSDQLIVMARAANRPSGK
jgi:predicted DsbA family dithiol-disulfide isomerase